jgi:hypothetical protein
MPATFGNTPVGTSSARPYFDNLSDDGAGCNIGFLLTNAPGVNNNCANQRPANWLPFTGTAPTHFLGNGNNATNFMFSGGTYTVDIIYANNKTLGDVAFANATWGIFTGTPGTDTDLNAGGALPYTFSTASQWGFFIDMQDGVGGRRYSNNLSFARQFSLFGFGPATANINAGIVTPVSAPTQTFYVGLEDKGCTSNTGPGCNISADFDNNDVIFRVRLVPEPSTYLLMAAGLAGLAAFSRRRRTA